MMIDREWEQLSIAELHRFDALCDRFERALTQDPSTRIELFIADLPEPQQRLIARELIPMEIERRRSIGESASSDEFASRFPAWADELRELATQCIEELSQSPASESESDTIDEKADFETSSDTKRNNLQIQGGQPWAVSSEFARHLNLPSDGVLGHYRLLSVIGRGGMGLVVRAHDTKLTRDVAIKFFYTPLHFDDRTRERFLREAQSSAVIRHNHVVTIYAVEEIDRTPFLVMELVEGPTLDGYLRQSGRLATNEVVSFACQLAEGLAAAHKQGLIHRDIKPANILLDNTSGVPSRVHSLSDWNIKLTDFGLARIAADVQLTDSGVIAGTPQYMSPEQANGQDIDCRSDLFSLGSVMYAMCTGQPAFLAGTPLGILRQVAEKPPRPIREVSPQTPFWLIEIIDKLMAKSPSDRFQSADELVQKLSHHINVSLLGHPEPVAEPARDTSLRRLVLGLVIGGCFAAVIAGVTYFQFARKATVRFEVNDPKIQVTIAGDDVSITDGNADYRVAAGDHDLSVKYGELEFTTKDFHLSQGEYVRLRVTYLDKQLSVERDGHELWTGNEKSDESAVVKSSTERSTRHVWPSDAPAPAIIPFTLDNAKRHQEEWASHLGISVEFENTIGMKFRVIPPGEFQMGSSDSEVERELRIARESKMLDWVSSFIPFEAPRHSVVLTKPYAIGIYEVTRGQFGRFVEATGYLTDAERSPKGGTGFRNGMLIDSPDFNWKTDLGFQPPQTDESPVVNVSWDDATQFCQWLSEKEGQTYRLPHEAEWEFACRAGNPGRFSFGDDAQKIHEYAWVGDGTSRGAIQVGQRKPNALGLFDTQGNVWEFCQDWHGSYPVDAVTDPTGPPRGPSRVGRGGTWGSYPELCRSAYRSSGNSGAYSSGFRVVRTLSIGTDGQANQNRN